MYENCEINTKKFFEILLSRGRSFKDKAPVFGMYQRGGKLVAKVVPDTRAKTLSPILSDYVATESRVFTDGWEYGDMRSYEQMSVDHGIGFYGTTVVDADGVCYGMHQWHRKCVVALKAYHIRNLLSSQQNAPTTLC